MRGVSKNNNKLLIIDWIVSHMLTMTKNFSNNAILRGLNNCSPQKDGKNSCRLMRGDVRKTTRKVAFTLAEVLITLGIIGVVAAMTLPTLVANYKKQVLVEQLKKTVNSIENNSRKLIADEGVDSIKDTPLYTDGHLNTDILEKYYLLKPVSDNSLFSQTISSLNIYYYSFGATKLFLPSGACLAFPLRGQPLQTILVDVNCDSSPNLPGYDRFVLDFNSLGL